jgi:hypothetical protein
LHSAASSASLSGASGTSGSTLLARVVAAEVLPVASTVRADSVSGP